MGHAESDRVVARQGRLARQGVHRLGPRDPRDPLHGEAGDLPGQQSLHQLRLVRRVDEADQDRAGFHGVDDGEGRGLNRQDHVRLGDHRDPVIEDGDILERGILQPDRGARAGLHVQLAAELDQLGNDRGRQGDAPFVRLGLLQNGDVDIHGGSSS